MKKLALVMAAVGVLAWIGPRSLAEDRIPVAQPKAQTGPVDAQPASSSKPADAPWTTLFENEQWYRNENAKEQTYSGTLDDVKGAGRVSVLQRDSYYKLGSRTIFTGAKKVDALDRLVGKKVEIYGKPYDISLEGKHVSEIWPAAIREQ